MFGKRVVTPSTPTSAPAFVPAGPDSDGEMRIIPKATWDGPNGDKLRQLGLSPDDPANLVLAPERARALEDAATARMNAVVAKVNAHIPGVTVAPWAIIPWSVWEGPNAEFLIKSDFMPSSPWNNMLLAADAESAAFFGLPQHPRAVHLGLAENLTSLIDELRVASRADNEQNLAALSRGDFSVLDRYEQLKTDRFQKLFQLARHVATDVFGAEVCARHDELFGFGLTEVTG